MAVVLKVTESLESVLFTGADDITRALTPDNMLTAGLAANNYVTLMHVAGLAIKAQIDQAVIAGDAVALAAIDPINSPVWGDPLAYYTTPAP